MFDFDIGFTNLMKDTKFRKDDVTPEEIEACFQQTCHEPCYLSLKKFFK